MEEYEFDYKSFNAEVERSITEMFDREVEHLKEALEKEICSYIESGDVGPYSLYLTTEIGNADEQFEKGELVFLTRRTDNLFNVETSNRIYTFSTAATIVEFLFLNSDI